VLPAALREGRVIAHRFIDREGRPGYWRDVGTLHSYWRAHMDLALPKPPLDLGDPAWPLWTRPLHLPPARIVQNGSRTAGSVRNAILSPGCSITDATVRHSVLSTGVTIEAGAVVEQSVLLPGVVIGRGACVHRAVVAPGVHIPEGGFVGESELDDGRGEVTLVHEWQRRDSMQPATVANVAARAC
jgi:glucose-1-phosphate adenylyltransferase